MLGMLTIAWFLGSGCQSRCLYWNWQHQSNNTDVYNYIVDLQWKLFWQAHYRLLQVIFWDSGWRRGPCAPKVRLETWRNIYSRLWTINLSINEYMKPKACSQQENVRSILKTTGGLWWACEPPGHVLQLHRQAISSTITTYSRWWQMNPSFDHHFII